MIQAGEDQSALEEAFAFLRRELPLLTRRPEFARRVIRMAEEKTGFISYEQRIEDGHGHVEITVVHEPSYAMLELMAEVARARSGET